MWLVSILVLCLDGIEIIKLDFIVTDLLFKDEIGLEVVRMWRNQCIFWEMLLLIEGLDWLVEVVFMVTNAIVESFLVESLFIIEVPSRVSGLYILLLYWFENGVQLLRRGNIVCGNKSVWLGGWPGIRIGFGY